MTKKIISTALCFVFITTMVLPSLVLIVDSEIEFSLYSDLNEENEKENEIEIDYLFFNVANDDALLTINYLIDKLSKRKAKYDSPGVNLTSPPPEYSC